MNVWPFKQDTSTNSPESPYLEIRNQLCSADLKQKFVDFRIHRTPHFEVKSKDIIEKKFYTVDLTLLEQSIKLNCLSSNIKREQSKLLYRRPGRFEANFIQSHFQTSSLRNHLLVLYLQRDFNKLYSFIVRYFPDLTNIGAKELQPTVHEEVLSVKKRKINPCIKSVSVDKTFLEKKLKDQPASIKTSSSDMNQVSLFNTFTFQIVEHGKLLIQSFDESGDVVCIMNDYSATDGSFRETEFVYTLRLIQETGNYFYCSCSTYSTLLEVLDNQRTNEFVVLDSVGKNCVTCMHCKFLSQYVLPNLELDCEECVTPIRKLVYDALRDNKKEIVELVRKNNTRKFSVFLEGDGHPTFVHITFNQGIEKYIVSCMNGQCLSKKGHKRNLETFEKASVCKHLSILQNHLEYWQDLKLTEALDANNRNNVKVRDEGLSSSDVPPISSKAECNFDDETGLWHFKCKSSHKPSAKGCESLKFNLQTRDLWNDSNLKRDTDGYLIGPSLFPDIPDNTCGCGAGWLKREDNENYCKNGRVVNENGRILTIYTSSAPVKCRINSRICYGENKQCKIDWDEGSSESLHVLSRDTAAGDEIGWEFVSLVMNSGCTFSSFCKLKNVLYQMRDSRAKFMDPTVFLNWWFSWAAMMIIDFRQSCDVCGTEPKRLCCDGTKIGVGFRHATFEEIENVDPQAPEHETLHRRMNRCFLRNCAEISIPQMLKNREMLDYLAKESLGELKPLDILTAEDRQNGILLLRQALPRDFLLSFDKFYPFDTLSNMPENEQVAYAYVVKMLATTASITSLLPPKYCSELQHLLEPHIDDLTFNSIMNNMRCYAPELRDLIAESLKSNNSNSEICEQFYSFLQNIKKSARQMTQEHFCFYLQFFLHQWNIRKKMYMRKKLRWLWLD